MKNKQLLLILSLMLLILSVSTVSAENSTDLIAQDNNDDNAIYVDANSGSDRNNGAGINDAVKTIKTSITISKDNSTIYLADGIYKGTNNVNLVVDKSLNFIGSNDTVIDGEKSSNLFVISDNVKVTFKNIKFVNASMSGNGAAININNADVLIDNCQFINNTAKYVKDSIVNGGAISNLGNLTISNSYFYLNSVEKSGFGGAIYNNAHMTVINSSFVNSSAGESSKGGTIYNGGIANVVGSVFAYSYAYEDSMGGTIYNTGNFTLTDSILENNTVERYDFNFIYGNIFNSGVFSATGNIFKNNTAYYKQPNAGYDGCPTFYNVGDLILNFNAFIDNVGGFKKVYTDVFLNGGKNIDLNNNWWSTNANPFTTQQINVDVVTSQIILDVTPSYSALKINDTVDLIASWKLNNGRDYDFSISFDVIFKTENNEYAVTSKNGKYIFKFNDTQVKGLNQVNVTVNSFTQSVNVDVGKINTSLNVDINGEIYPNQPVTVNVKLFDENSTEMNEDVYVIIDGQEKLVNDGVAIFYNLPAGIHDVYAEYRGSDIYFKSFNKTTLTVNRFSAKISIDDISDVKVDEKFNIKVNLETSEVEGAANLYVNGEFKQIVYLMTGSTKINLANFKEGRYNLTVETMGSGNYKSTNASVIFYVNRYDTLFNVYCDNITVGENATLQINTLNNFTGEVKLIINGVESVLFLNNKTANFTLSGLKAGLYDVELIFDGNGMFNPQNASSSFVVSKIPSILNVNVDDNIIDVNVMTQNATGAVNVYVNSKKYNLNLTDGKATFNVEFDEGTNYIFVEYEGDDVYDYSNWNTTVGEGEAVYIEAVNITSFEYNDFNFTVQIFENSGIAIPNKIINVDLDGKSYEVTTNSMGIGVLTLNLKSGNYTVISSYKNLSTINYIVINPVEFNLTSNNISYTQSAVVKVDFDNDIRGYVNFTVNNMTQLVKIEDGSATLTLDGLECGNYNVQAFYTNDYFSSKSKFSSFEVFKLDSEISLDISEAFLGEDEIIAFNSNNLTGQIIFEIDNVPYAVNITDAKATLTLSNLDGGIHHLKVIYAGDEIHNNVTLTQNFSIKTLKTDLTLSVNATEYAKDVIVMAKINATGNVTFSVENLRATSQIKDGIAKWNFTGLNVGTYTINATYSGNDYYLSASAQSNVKIIKAQSTIELYVEGVYLDENIKIFARLSPNATGKVSFGMTDYYSPRDKTVSDAQASWLIAPLQTGQYNVYATYRGDSNYYSSSTTFTLVVSQTRSVLTVEANDASNRDNVIVKATLTSINEDNVTGSVSIQIGSKAYRINVRDGKGQLNLGKLSPGNYNIMASFDGDENYSNSSATASFYVSDYLLESQLSCENVTKYYNSGAKLTLTLKNANGKPISQALIRVVIKNIQSTYLTDDEGKVYIDIENTIEKYDVEAFFDGSDSYHPSNASGHVEVLTTVEAVDIVKVYGSGDQYFALFRGLDGKALSSKEVYFKIQNKTYNYTTLPNGIVRLNINLLPATYEITAINPITGQNVVNTIKIFMKLAENKNVVNYFGAKTVYKVRAFGNDGNPVGAGVNVTFKVNGKTYIRTTDKNGYAKLSISLKAKQYVITAEFNGTKVSNKITVKPVLTVKITSSKKTKKTTFKAKLVNTKGKVLKGKKITFKIKGKKYVAKTNKKGIASISLKLKLKKGTYKIYTIYGKSKILNKIKVK